MVPNSLQASVCDEQLMSIGGEIALSGNTDVKIYVPGVVYNWLGGASHPRSTCAVFHTDDCFWTQLHNPIHSCTVNASKKNFFIKNQSSLS